VIALAAGVSACSGSAGETDAPASALPSDATELLSQADIELFIPAPASGSFDAPVWLPKRNEFIVTYYPKGDDPRRRQLYRMGSNGSGLKRLRLPERPSCLAVWNGNGVALADGRVAYAQQCFGGDDFARATRLMAYDPETESAEPLFAYGLSFVAAIFDYSRDGVGVLNDHNGLEERLHWLRPDGLDAIELPLERAGYPS
jgi:hypothetical protein